MSAYQYELLNATEKMVEIVNFMVCVFFHNKVIGGGEKKSSALELNRFSAQTLAMALPEITGVWCKRAHCGSLLSGSPLLLGT